MSASSNGTNEAAKNKRKKNDQNETKTNLMNDRQTLSHLLNSTAVSAHERGGPSPTEISSLFLDFEARRGVFEKERKGKDDDDSPIVRISRQPDGHVEIHFSVLVVRSFLPAQDEVKEAIRMGSPREGKKEGR